MSRRPTQAEFPRHLVEDSVGHSAAGELHELVREFAAHRAGLVTTSAWCTSPERNTERARDRSTRSISRFFSLGNWPHDSTPCAMPSNMRWVSACTWMLEPMMVTSTGSTSVLSSTVYDPSCFTIRIVVAHWSPAPRRTPSPLQPLPHGPSGSRGAPVAVEPRVEQNEPRASPRRGRGTCGARTPPRGGAAASPNGSPRKSRNTRCANSFSSPRPRC